MSGLQWGGWQTLGLADGKTQVAWGASPRPLPPGHRLASPFLALIPCFLLLKASWGKAASGVPFGRSRLLRLDSKCL